MRTTRLSARTRNKERGIALLLALFALLLLSAIAMGMMYMADTENSVANNYRDSQAAYFGAHAGLQEVRPRLVTGATNPIVAPVVVPTVAGGGVIYVINPAGAGDPVTPWVAGSNYFDDELCHEGFYGGAVADPGVGIRCAAVPIGAAWYTQTTATGPYANTAGALSYKWVRVTLKTNGSTAPYYVNGSNAAATLTYMVCWNGTNQTVAPVPGNACPAGLKPVYLLTSLAITPTGARRMVQQEVAQITMPPLPGALTLDGPAPVFGAPNSNPYHIQGNDTPSCGAPGPPKAGIAAYDAAGDTAITNAIPGGRVDHYAGSSCNGVGACSPDVQNVGPTGTNTLGGWSSTATMESIIAMIQSSADQVLTGPVSNPAIGTDAAPLVTFVNGDVSFSGATRGAGLLVVTGTLNLSGNSGFNGIILVIGQGVMNVNGGGNGQYNGGVLIAKTRDAAGNVLATPGSPTLNWNGGGGNGIYYDSCWTNNAMNKFQYQALMFREEMY